MKLLFLFIYFFYLNFYFFRKSNGVSSLNCFSVSPLPYGLEPAIQNPIQQLPSSPQRLFPHLPGGRGDTMGFHAIGLFQYILKTVNLYGWNGLIATCCIKRFEIVLDTPLKGIVNYFLQRPCFESIYLLKVNNGNTRIIIEICSKLTIQTLKRHHWRRWGVFNVNFEQISHNVLVFLLLTLNT